MAKRGRGGSNYILERCLHISKSYVSCLGKKYDIVFYLFTDILVSLEFSPFRSEIRKKENAKKKKKKKNNYKTCCCRGKFRGIFVLFLPCTLLYSSIYGDFYLYMCKKANI